MLKKAPAFSATAFKHGVESRKCCVIAVSLGDIGTGAGAEMGADTVAMDALLRVRVDTGSSSKANDCTLEAPSFRGLPGFLFSLTPPVTALTRSRGMCCCILSPSLWVDCCDSFPGFPSEKDLLFFLAEHRVGEHQINS